MAVQKNKKGAGRPSKEFNFMSFVWRFVASLMLVLLTYNPTRFSYWGWIRHTQSSETLSLGPEHLVVGILVLIGWAILLSATQRSLGAIGLILVVAFLGGLVWMLSDFGLLSLTSMSSVTWVGLVCISLLLAIGLSWSHVWRRLTGQFEVDDGDD
jgi:hypothetical protein